ncbi:hypothetical protein SAMN03159335_06245 [Burkholderia cepacia]|nr:hypothetical protein SAMN03159335_06245 [Burkholderia cepacia]
MLRGKSGFQFANSALRCAGARHRFRQLRESRVPIFLKAIDQPFGCFGSPLKDPAFVGEAIDVALHTLHGDVERAIILIGLLPGLAIAGRGGLVVIDDYEQTSLLALNSIGSGPEFLDSALQFGSFLGTLALSFVAFGPHLDERLLGGMPAGLFGSKLDGQLFALSVGRRRSIGRLFGGSFRRSCSAISFGRSRFSGAHGRLCFSTKRRQRGVCLGERVFPDGCCSLAEDFEKEFGKVRALNPDFCSLLEPLPELVDLVLRRTRTRRPAILSE